MESNTVVKALGLLESVAVATGGTGLAGLAAGAGLPKPTAHRLLKTLAAMGYVEKASTGVYRAGPGLRRLTGQPLDESLRLTARPALDELHRATQETVNLGVLQNGRVVYLEVLESPQPLRRVATPASADPFFCTALGRVIVANLPDDRINFLLRSMPREPRTEATVTDERQLREILAEVRAAGCAVETDQTDVGVTCLAAPIRDAQGVRAALSLSVPSPRADAERREQWLALVRATADRISGQLAAPLD